MTNFKIPAGDTLRVRIKVYANNTRTAALNLAGKTFTFVAADSGDNPTVTITKTLGSGITVLNEVDGSVQLVLTPTDTNSFGERGGVVKFYFRVIDGSDVYTVDTGKIVFQRLLT